MDGVYEWWLERIKSCVVYGKEKLKNNSLDLLETPSANDRLIGKGEETGLF